MEDITDVKFEGAKKLMAMGITRPRLHMGPCVEGTTGRIKMKGI